MQTYYRIKWRFWERTLEVTGWLFGYNHPVYFGVKESRNAAYFKFKFYRGRNEKQ